MSGIEAINRVIEYVNAYVWQSVPGVVKGLAIALVFALIFRKQLKKHPVAFYIYPVVFLLWCTVSGIIELVDSNAYENMGWEQSWIMNIGWAFDELGLGTLLGIGLIIIVMFIGVLPKVKLVQNLYTIRTEMSVIGATLLAAHGIEMLPTTIYWFVEAEYEHGFFILFFLMYGLLGPIILALLLIPWITSFRVVRKKMSGRTWKRLQTWLGVPLFIGMLIFGLILNLAWSVGWYPDFVNMWEITVAPWDEAESLSLGAGAGFAEYLLAAKIYLVLLVSYSILRIKKYKKNNVATTNLSETNSQTQENA
jgi:DMSO/TMAO reductase YedYZ heme-binding membrane subunit